MGGAKAATPEVATSVKPEGMASGSAGKAGAQSAASATPAVVAGSANAPPEGIPAAPKPGSKASEP